LSAFAVMKIDSTARLTIELNMAGPPSPPAVAPPPSRPALPLHQRPINLIRGWPSPDILPVDLLRSAALRVFADPAISTPALQYGPDPGYEPLREGLAAWLGRHFAVTPDPKRICITGGASQSLACVLQSYADPAYTRAVWMIAPCYHLACPMFEEGGFSGRLRVAREDDEGIDLEALEDGIKRLDREQEGLPQREVSLALCPRMTPS
jgi:DNA-binding transcriptional MocR family regulator